MLFGSRIGKSKKEFNWLYIPAFIIVFVIPVIKLHIPVMHNKEMAGVLLKTRWYDDYYSLVKVIFLYIATVLMFFVFILKSGRTAKIHGCFYLLVPYAGFILLSMLFSDYRISALFGIVDHYEGALTQLCYCCILVFSYFLAEKVSNIIAVFKITAAASLVVSSIGLLQFSGLLKTDEPYTISSSIGNPNYVGSYAVLLLPVAFVLIWIESGLYKKILYLFIVFGSAFFLLVGSMSRAGYLGLIAGLFVLPVLLGYDIRKRYKWFMLLAAYGVLIFIAMNAFSAGIPWKEAKSLVPVKAGEKHEKLYFKNICLNDSSAVVETNRWYLEIRNAGGGFLFYDGNGGEIPVRETDGGQTIEFPEEQYPALTGYMAKEDELDWLMLQMEGKDIEFVCMSGRMKIVGYNGQLTGIEPVRSFGFKGNESFASGRGYIWSRAIPLLEKAFFIGYGPDTFTYIFPQNDIVGKLNYGAIWVVISKPHCWYLQIALGSGILSLLCLLALFAWYFIETIGILKRSSVMLRQNNGMNGQDNQKRIIAAGILLSILGYCVAGIFNDSVVAVSPIFWMFLGFGMRLSANLRVVTRITVYYN